jgi:hypothetical protein
MFYTRRSEMRSEEDNRDAFLEGLVDLSYHERLTCFLRGAARHWVAGGISVIDFRPLYTVTLHNLQRQLAEEIQQIEGENVTEEQLSRIRETLHKYSTLTSTPTPRSCLPNAPQSQRTS